MITPIRVCCYKNKLELVEQEGNPFWTVSVFENGNIVSFGFGRTLEDARKTALIILKDSGYII